MLIVYDHMSTTELSSNWQWFICLYHVHIISYDYLACSMHSMFQWKHRSTKYTQAFNWILEDGKRHISIYIGLCWHILLEMDATIRAMVVCTHTHRPLISGPPNAQARIPFVHANKSMSLFPNASDVCAVYVYARSTPVHIVRLYNIPLHD